VVAYEEAKAHKEEWDTALQTLRDRKAEIDGRADATEEQKNQAQSDLDDHLANQTVVTSALTDATNAKETKEGEMEAAQKIRDDAAYAKEKQEGDARYEDLETQKADEEEQLADLEGSLEAWKGLRDNALAEGDDETYAEMQAEVERTQKQVADLSLRLEATTNSFELERAAKETRDLAEAAEAEQEGYRERTAARED